MSTIKNSFPVGAWRKQNKITYTHCLTYSKGVNVMSGSEPNLSNG